MLFSADRNEHLNGPHGIIEHVKKGHLVVSDRYVLSSLVYQGIECGDELPGFLNSRFGIPELTIFFDIEPDIALKRTKRRNSQEIYDYIEFQEKVREKYKSLIGTMCALGAKVETIDASKSMQEVADHVWSIVAELPIFNA
jgi:dTMP kinase